MSKTHVSAALACAWARTAQAHGKGALADAVDGSTKLIDRALTGECVPELHTALNSLRVDATALDEVLALYGFRLVPSDAAHGDDMALATALASSVAEYLKRMADGVRCHVDTAVLAQLFRPLIPQMQAIVDQADRMRSG